MELARYDATSRVRVSGFTEQMSEWLAAGDASCTRPAG